MELTYQNFDDAAASLVRGVRSTIVAKGKVQYLFETMQAIAGHSRWSHVWTVHEATDEVLKANVDGMEFDILAYPTVHDLHGKVICYVVVTDPVTEETREVARFMVTSSGEIQYANGERMHSPDDAEAPGLLLANISALVLAPRPE